MPCGQKTAVLRELRITCLYICVRPNMCKAMTPQGDNFFHFERQMRQIVSSKDHAIALSYRKPNGFDLTLTWPALNMFVMQRGLIRPPSSFWPLKPSGGQNWLSFSFEGLNTLPPQPPGIVGLSKSPHASDKEEEDDADEGSRSRSLATGLWSHLVVKTEFHFHLRGWTPSPLNPQA